MSRSCQVGILLALLFGAGACSSRPGGGGFNESGDGGGGDSSSQAGDSGAAMSIDGFEASRTACINKINALRATDTALKLAPYTLVDNKTVDTCVDTQANNDQHLASPHHSFINSSPACMWGAAMAFAQDECGDGYGTTPAGIERCLQDMWNESLKPNCVGCVGCTQFGGACPKCDAAGTMGYECGHYVNMSAPYFTTVACGFAGAAPSSATGWSAQNFE